MQSKVRSVCYELGHGLHQLVDVPRRDEQAFCGFILSKSGGVHDGGQADGNNGAAEIFRVYGGSVIADAAAGGYTRIADLDVTAKPADLAAG